MKFVSALLICCILCGTLCMGISADDNVTETSGETA